MPHNACIMPATDLRVTFTETSPKSESAARDNKVLFPSKALTHIAYHHHLFPTIEFI